MAPAQASAPSLITTVAPAPASATALSTVLAVTTSAPALVLALVFLGRAFDED
jgi:hypothetical protein